MTIQPPPPGWHAVPLAQAEQPGGMKVCVLVQPVPPIDSPGGHLFLLREQADTDIYLGCLTDSEGAIREWLELWCQASGKLLLTGQARRFALTNDTLDRLWGERWQQLRTQTPEDLIPTGQEDRAQAPIFVALEAEPRAVPLHPAERLGEWRLCEEDRVLEDRSLPPYRSTMSRFLHRDREFLAVTADADAPAVHQGLDDQMQRQGRLIVFNREGGRIILRRHYPLALDEFCDVLAGKRWRQTGEHAQRELPAECLGGVYSRLLEWSKERHGDGCLFTDRAGGISNLLECFHLRLCLVGQAIQAVRDAVARSQMPLLNLGPDSFRVGLQATGGQLPFLWTAKCVIVSTGDAFATAGNQAGGPPMFARLSPGSPSIYQPDEVGGYFQGTGTVVFLGTPTATTEGYVLEGRLQPREEAPVAAGDRLTIVVTFQGQKLSFVATVEEAKELRRIRFRATVRDLPPSLMVILKGNHPQNWFPQSPFTIAPCLNTPCDLHSLAIIAVRCLLTNHTTRLFDALDALSSLAVHICSVAEPKESTSKALKRVLADNPDLREKLDSSQLIHDEQFSREQAANAVPSELWQEMLALILQMMPGKVPDSFCENLADTPDRALEAVFAEPLARWQQLVQRSRCLTLGDWRANRDVRAVVTAFLQHYPR